MAAPAPIVRAPGRAPSRPGALVTDALLVLMAVIWAVNYSVAKFGTRTVTPLAYNAVRIAMAAVMFIVIAGARTDGRPARRDLLRLLALGVVGNGVYQFFFIEGLARTRAGTVALMLAASPAFVALTALALGRDERVGPRGWAGIALQLAGIGCVVFGTAAGSTGGEDTLLGNLLVLAGSACWALFAVLVKPYTQTVSGIQLGAITLAGGALFSVVVALPGLATTEWTAVTPVVWLAIIYSGIAALVVGNLIWYHGVSVIGPTRVSMYSNLQPLVALAVAWFALGEVPTLWQGLGAGSIMTGLLITRT